MVKERLLTPEQVAEQLQVKTSTVLAYLRTGALRGVKLGGRIWRVDPKDLEKFIAKQKRGSR